MNLAQKLLAKRYLDPIKEEPEFFIGVELEYPIVNTKGEATDPHISKSLMNYIVEKLDFHVEKRDQEGNPIQLVQANGDCILFEVSYNTLEFAFAKAKTIQEIDDRLEAYLAVIQPYLQGYDHELQGKGINPNWKKNDNHPVASPRYQMLMDFLKLKDDRHQQHDYADYGAFICGNQVQLDVSKSKVFRVLNAFNLIEPVKAHLFANSPFPDLAEELTLSRDIFWEESMHGVLPANIGLYPESFPDAKSYLAYLESSAVFHAERKGSSTISTH